MRLCRFACTIGHVEHMARIARRIRDECDVTRSCRGFLNGLILQLEEGVLAAEQDARLAVAMALHSRLGSAAGIACLGADLLPLCLPESAERGAIGTWREVLCEC
jgi:hypothetical protein